MGGAVPSHRRNKLKNCSKMVASVVSLECVSHNLFVDKIRYRSGKKFCLYRMLQAFYWTFDVTQWHAQILRTLRETAFGHTPYIVKDHVDFYTHSNEGGNTYIYIYMYMKIWRFTNPSHFSFSLNSISIFMLKISCRSSSQVSPIPRTTSGTTVCFTERVRFPCNDYTKPLISCLFDINEENIAYFLLSRKK
jgi:hypothetical protein